MWMKERRGNRDENQGIWRYLIYCQTVQYRKSLENWPSSVRWSEATTSTTVGTRLVKWLIRTIVSRAIELIF